MQRGSALKVGATTMSGAAMLLSLATATPSVAGAAQGATLRESQHSRVVFENDHVRVNELFASAGAESAMHAQDPGVLVSVTKARFEMTAPSGAVSLADYHAGQVSWVGERQHRRWKLLAGDAHIFFVEVKSAATASAPAPVELGPKHSTVIDPDQHHLAIDNEHVRVIDGLAGPGARSAAHTHPPSVLISLAKSRFKVTINGRTRIFDFEPATVRWTNHFEHTWEILAGEARVIMVEVKSAHTAPEFRRRT